MRHMAVSTVHNAFCICPVMRHILVRVDLIAAFGGVSLGGGGKFIEGSMTIETDIFAVGCVCGGVRLGCRCRRGGSR